MKHVMVGFGFGPIQSGLFAKEASESCNFAEIVIAEIDASLVTAVRDNGDRYMLNVATAHGVEEVEVKGVRLLNPADAADARQLKDALSRATEIVTSLPSVDFYTRDAERGVAAQIAEALCASPGQTVVYTAENNNHAAEILLAAVGKSLPWNAVPRAWQPLNTVIGKMSQVINDEREIESRGLALVAPGFPRAFLVESFNKILTSQITLPGFQPGITAFDEKADLLPFEEAKLYGHNAIHTMLGFLAWERGLTRLSELRGSPELMKLARDAFVRECGTALIARYASHGDPLFTRDGFEHYADDLLDRMTNPYLRDTVARAIRDPMRKLGKTDRVFGTIRLCLAQGVKPVNLVRGALSGLRFLAGDSEMMERIGVGDLELAPPVRESEVARVLNALWGSTATADEVREISALLTL